MNLFSGLKGEGIRFDLTEEQATALQARLASGHGLGCGNVLPFPKGAQRAKPEGGEVEKAPVSQHGQNVSENRQFTPEDVPSPLWLRIVLIALIIGGWTALSGCEHLERVPVDRPVALDVPLSLTDPTPLPVLPWEGLQGVTRAIAGKDIAVAWDRAEVALGECNADKADIRVVIEAQKAFVASPAQGWNSLMRAMTTAGKGKKP